MIKTTPSEVPEKASKTKRLFLTAEKKFQIYLEAQSPDKPVGELLRREGLFSTDLARTGSRSRKAPCNASAPNLGGSARRSTRVPTTRSSASSRTRIGPWRIWRLNWPSCEKKRMGVRGTDDQAVDQG